VRLIGAVLAEQHDEWAVVRRYMTVDGLLKPAPLRLPALGTKEAKSKRAEQCSREGYRDGAPYTTCDDLARHRIASFATRQPPNPAGTS